MSSIKVEKFFFFQIRIEPRKTTQSLANPVAFSVLEFISNYLIEKIEFECDNCGRQR